jgi:hypothetical protein
MAAGAAAAVAGAAVPRVVELDPEEVLLQADVDIVLARLKDRFGQGPDVLAGNEHRVVRRFSGAAGAFRYATVELVEYRRSGITFEHLRGPFAECHEWFDLTPSGEGSRLVHSGTFTLRGGIWTWPFARLVVKRSFQAHVREHLLEMRKDVADRRRRR